MVGTLQIVNFIVTIITGTFTILVMVCKPFRKMILKGKEDKEKERQNEEERRETDRCVLRELMETMYYKRRNTCELYQYEYESFAYMYKQYKKLNGNSFVDRIWSEIQEWTILP